MSVEVFFGKNIKIYRKKKKTFYSGLSSEGPFVKFFMLITSFVSRFLCKYSVWMYAVHLAGYWLMVLAIWLKQ